MRRFLTLARLTTRARQEQQLELPLAVARYQSSFVRPLHQSAWLCLKSSNEGGNSRAGRGDSSSSSSSSFSRDSTQSGRRLGKSKHSKLGQKQQGADGKGLMGRNAGRSLAGDRQSPEQVKLDKRRHRFTLDLGNNQVARIDFKSLGPNTIEMYHTEVPAELRNRGLGKVLAAGALRQAANNNMRVRLTCSYLVDYVNQNQDPSAHVVDK